MMQTNYPQWPGWEVTRLIGNGSFGAVYEIQRSFYGSVEKAALKVIRIPQNNSDIEELYNDGFDDESITARFNSYLEDIIREYALMATMKGNKNVVYCDDVRQIQHEDGIGWDIYIKMELLTPLVKTIGRTVPESTVLDIGIDMCSALVICKEHGIIHRDIKPQNIFVSPDGTYKLGDFGIAKTAERTTSGTKTGTYKYMAPEVYKSLPYGAAADQYSLGMVLYWLLNERRTPFLPLPSEVKATTLTMEDEARKRRFDGEQIPPPAHGSKMLQAIVLKACAFDPKERFRSAQEMLMALKALRDGPSAAGAAGIGGFVPYEEEDLTARADRSAGRPEEEELTARAKKTADDLTEEELTARADRSGGKPIEEDLTARAAKSVAAGAAVRGAASKTAQAAGTRSDKPVTESIPAHTQRQEAVIDREELTARADRRAAEAAEEELTARADRRAAETAEEELTARTGKNRKDQTGPQQTAEAEDLTARSATGRKHQAKEEHTRRELDRKEAASAASKQKQAAVDTAHTAAAGVEEGTVGAFHTAAAGVEEGTVGAFHTAAAGIEEGTVGAFHTDAAKAEEGTVGAFHTAAAEAEEGTVGAFQAGTAEKTGEGTVGAFRRGKTADRNKQAKQQTQQKKKQPEKKEDKKPEAEKQQKQNAAAAANHTAQNKTEDEKKKKPLPILWISLAAGLLVVAGVVALILSGNKPKPKPTEPTNPVQLDWTEWSDELPTFVSAADYMIEERTVYCSRQLETTQSTESDKMDGWELYDTATGDGGFGAWGDWSQDKAEASDTREVETQTRYRYSDKETTTGSSKSMDGWTLENTTTNWGDWGGWSDWSQNAASKSDSRDVQSQKRYRYRDKETTTSTSSSLSGWTQYDVVTSQGDWGSWSGWSANAVSANNNTQVETKTQYSYRDKSYTTSTDGNLSGWTQYDSSVEYGSWSGWSESPISASSSVDVETKEETISDDSGTYTKQYYRYREIRRNYKYYSWGAWTDYSDTAVSGSGDREVRTRTVYRSRTRSQGASTYKYYRWGGWSDWSTNAVSSNSNREVQTQTYYRYRDRKGTSVYHFSRWKPWSEWSETAVKESGSRKVETTTFYRFRDRVFETTYYFQRWTDWTDFSDKPVEQNETTEVQTKTQYRYRTKDGAEASEAQEG